MSRYDNLKKNRSSNPPEEEDLLSTSRYQSIKANRGRRNYGVDDNFINTFIQDAQSFFTTSQKDINNLTWQSGTDKTKSQARNDALADLENRSATIRAYLNANKGKLSETTYSDLMSVIDQVDSGSKDIFHAFSSAEKMFATFANEDHWNAYNMPLEDVQAKLAQQDSLDAAINDLDTVANSHVPYEGYNDEENVTDEELAIHQAYLDVVERLYADYGEGYETVDDFYWEKLYGINAIKFYNELLDKKELSRIAYIDKNGEEVTWQKVYDDAIAMEKWKSDLLADQTFREKYRSMTYGDISRILETIEDGEEKEWLTSYAPTVMTVEDYETEILNVEAELKVATADLELYHWLIVQAAQHNTDEASQNEINALNEKYGGQLALEQYVENLKAKKWELENGKKYNFLSQNEDFEQQSEVAVTERKSNLITYFLSPATKHYDLINGFLEDSSKYRDDTDKYFTGLVFDIIEEHLTFMTQDEKKKYNYLYNTQGEESAEDYLKYLESTLSERSLKYTADVWRGFTEILPFQANILNIPLTLWSGAGYLDVLVQNIVKNGKETWTGEYAGPINYNTAAMLPATAASAIQETSAQYLIDEFGVIDLDTDAYPILSTVLNGKSWADAYQLGVGVVDSAAIAVLSQAIGPAAMLMLSGSAATQTMLDAVEHGATDRQALYLGAVSGAMEYLFAKYEIGNLLENSSESVLRATINQALTEAFGEGSTTVSNMIADAIIMGDKSELNRRIATYMQDNPGMTEEEARKKAYIDMAVQVGWDAAGGFVSGGGMGLGAASINKVSHISIGNSILQRDRLGALTELGSSLGSDQVSNLIEQIGKNPSAGKVGQLYYAVSDAISQQSKQQLKDNLVRKGISTRGATKLSEAVVNAWLGGETTGLDNALINSVNTDPRIRVAVDEVLNDPASVTQQRYAQLQRITQVKQADTPRAPTEESNEGERVSTIATKGGVFYEYDGKTIDQRNDGKHKSLNNTQRVAVDFTKRLANGFGSAVYFYESYEDADGNRVYKAQDGSIKAARKGFYNPKDGSIHIDLNGENILFTVSHELVHFIRDWSPRQFKKMADLVMEGFNRQGLTAEELIANKQAEYAEDGIQLTEEEAFEEVIAAALEGIMADGRVMEFLQAAEAKDKGLGAKVRQFFQDISRMIRDTIDSYKDATPDSVEGRLIRQLEDIYSQLQEAFAEGVYDAGETFRQTENTTGEGGVKYSLMAFAKDGVRFVNVQVDQKLFDGLSVSEMNTLAKKIIKEKFAGKVVGIDNRTFVNGDSVHEYVYPSKAITSEIREAKLRAAPELDNLIDAGTNFRNSPDGADGHHHPNAVGGFDYFDTIFKVGNEYYYGLINIEVVKKGKRLKDITKIRNITKDIISSYGQNPKSDFLRDASMNSIRNPEQNVKQNSATDSDSDNSGVRYSAGAKTDKAARGIRENYQSVGEQIVDRDNVGALQALATELNDSNISNLTSVVTNANGQAHEQKVGQLYYAVSDAISQQSKQQLKDNLVRKGISTRGATKLSEAIVNAWLGGVPTGLDNALINSVNTDPRIRAAVDEVLNDPASVTQQRYAQLQSLLQVETDSTLQAAAEKASAEIVEDRRKNDVDFSRTFDRIKAERVAAQDTAIQEQAVTEQHNVLTTEELLDRINEFIDVQSLHGYQEKALNAYNQQKQLISELEASRQTHPTPTDLDNQIAEAKEKLQRIERRQGIVSTVKQIKRQIFRKYTNSTIKRYQLRDDLQTWQSKLGKLHARLNTIIANGEENSSFHVSEIQDEIAKYEKLTTEGIDALEQAEIALADAKSQAASIIDPEDRSGLLFDDKNVVTVNGKHVILAGEAFDSSFVDNKGRSNLQRMKDGLSPYGFDGRPLNIHHLDQTDNGMVMVIPGSLHQKYDGMLHTNTGQTRSQIDRKAFGKWRNSYWKLVGQQFFQQMEDSYELSKP